MNTVTIGIEEYDELRDIKNSIAKKVQDAIKNELNDMQSYKNDMSEQYKKWIEGTENGLKEKIGILEKQNIKLIGEKADLEIHRDAFYDAGFFTRLRFLFTGRILYDRP